MATILGCYWSILSSNVLLRTKPSTRQTSRLSFSLSSSSSLFCYLFFFVFNILSSSFDKQNSSLDIFIRVICLFGVWKMIYYIETWCIGFVCQHSEVGEGKRLTVSDLGINISVDVTVLQKEKNTDSFTIWICSLNPLPSSPIECQYRNYKH